jgi:ribosome recycling factor
MAVATGELIRAMNYVEDITATLRRICIYIPSMNAEERKRLAEAMRKAAESVNAAIADLEKAEK